MTGDDLERRLAQALRDGLDDEPVTVRPLVDGARRGATRIRRRRAVAAAGIAVLLVGSSPVALDLLGSDDVATQVAQSPTQRTAVPSEPPSEPPSDPPAATPAPTSPATSPSPEPLPALTPPTEFPDDVALDAERFAVPVDLTLDLGPYSRIPTVDGQSCDAGSNPDRPLPSVGRTWSWDAAGSSSLDQYAVTLSLTGWDDGEQALADVRDDTGYCTFLDPVTDRPVPGLPGEDAWSGSSTYDGLTFGYAVVRLGEVLVAVSVQHPEGEVAAAEEASRLVTAAADRAATVLG